MPRSTRSQRRDEPSTSRGTGSKRSLPVSESDSDSSAEEQQSRTRTSLAAPASTVDIGTLSNNMVKYLLNYSATKFPIKRAEVIKNVNFNQRLFPEVFNSAREKLLEVYGLEVSEVAESKSSKALIVHSSFNSVVSAIQLPPEQRHEITLLFIVLSYIFMKSGEVQEAHLTQFLEQLNIDLQEQHPLFGDVSKLIKEVFPRQLYLKRVKNEIEGVNETTITLVWGPRADKEFDKKTVLKAVADLMQKSPVTFINQYHEAYGEEPAATQFMVID